MAETENIFRPMEVYWTKDDADPSDTSVVYVPGMKASGNRRQDGRPPRVTGRKTAEIKPSIPVNSRQAKPAMLATRTAAKPPVKPPVKESAKQVALTSDKRPATLKDLCAEDKKRVANLVKELARVGEERETVLHVLDKERKHSEKQVHELVSQQENILKEREDIQTQLISCQELLAKFQRMSHDSSNKESERKAEMYTPEKPAHSSPPRSARQRSRSRSRDRVESTRQQQYQSSTREHPSHAETHGRPRTPTEQHRSHQTHRSRSGEKRHQSPAPTREMNQNVDTHRGEHYEPSEARKEYWGRGDTSLNNTVKGHYNDREGPGEHGVPNGAADRPFTSKIDQLIESERHTHGEFTEPPQHKGKRSPSTPFPLNAPVQSSTLRSEFSTDSGPSSAKSDFKPLLPDPSPAVSEYGSAQMNGLSSGSGKVEFKEPVSSNFPNVGSEQEFMQKYAQLKPDDRKRELFAQRQALLEEQRKLKSVLGQQEQLLLSKKEQLRKQQEIHKQRLQYFEENGHFPPHSFNEHLNNESAEVPRTEPHANTQPGGRDEMYPSEPPREQLPPVQQHQLPPHHPGQPPYHPQWEGHPSMPTQSLPYPPPPHGSHQIGPPLPPAAMPYMPSGSPYMPQVTGYPPDPRPLPPHVPAAPYHRSLTEEEKMVIESLRNMDMNRRHQQAHYPQGASMPAPAPESQQYYSQHSSPPKQEGIIPSMHSQSQSQSRRDHGWSEPIEDERHYPRSGGGSRSRNLLDIVDEVETKRRSVPHRNGSVDHRRHSNSNSDAEDRMNRSHDSYHKRDRREDRANSSFHGKSHKSKNLDTSDVTSEDELEESKVLSDIFFLK